MSQGKTHWRKYHDTDYIGAYTLLDAGAENLDVTIEKVIPEGVKGPDGRNEECVVAYLKGQKPFILNVTNCKMIAKLYNTPFVEDWTGKSITLYVAKVRAFGEFVEALRIRDKVPETVAATAVKTVMNPQYSGWEKARKAVLMGSVTVEFIKDTYELSEADEKLLTAPDTAPELTEQTETSVEEETPKTTAPEPTPEPQEEATPGLPVLNEQHEKWQGIRTALLDNLTTIESVRKQYTVSKEDELKLTVPPLQGE